MFIAIDGQIKTLVGVSDPIRSNAGYALRALRQLGWRVQLLSGDNPEIVNQVGQELGLSGDACLGDQSPEQKRDTVVAAQTANESVVMVGDGANDAAALVSSAGYLTTPWADRFAPTSEPGIPLFHGRTRVHCTVLGTAFIRP